MDRQHLRDFFDAKLRLEAEGTSEPIRQAFVVYLASYDRPMDERLNPTWTDISKIFESDFRRMTNDETELAGLLNVRERILDSLRRDLTKEEGNFLVSLKYGDPEWRLFGLNRLENLPALRWKRFNIRKMPKEKRDLAI